MSKIIEIIEIGFPQSLIQRDGMPCSELIKTEEMIAELNKILDSENNHK